MDIVAAAFIKKSQSTNLLSPAVRSFELLAPRSVDENLFRTCCYATACAFVENVPLNHRTSHPKRYRGDSTFLCPGSKFPNFCE